jgi:hypothetical protein
MKIFFYTRKSRKGNKNREDVADISNAIAVSATSNPMDKATSSSNWLCPIQSDSHRRGILQMTSAEYFDLPDKSGRMMRLDKQGAIDAGLAPIRLRIGARPEAWFETVSHFGSKFGFAAGRISSLRNFANQQGRRRIRGAAMARAALASS